MREPAANRPAERSSVSGLQRLIPWVPSIVAVILSLRSFWWGYLWDDYGFLQNAQGNPALDLLPQPGEMFYRPIPRGLYFLLVEAAGPKGPLLSHIINAAVAAIAVALFVSTASVLIGRRAGLIAGFSFAALSTLPFLVCWPSGAQDLIAIAFLLTALRLRLAGRNGLALLATALAMLSKETSLTWIPALIALDWLIGRRPFRIGRHLATYGALVLAWALIHPALGRLLGHGLRSGTTGYVGLEHPERWAPYFGKYLLTIINVPVARVASSWPPPGMFYLAIGIALSLVTLWLSSRRTQDQDSATRGLLTVSRAVLLATLLALPPLLITATMLRYWIPYYATIAGVGSSLLFGLGLSRLPLPWAAVALAAFFELGMVSRWERVKAGTNNELNFSEASAMLARIERGFKSLHPTLPPHSQVLVSVRARTGPAGAYTHMYWIQALKVWYHDLTIVTRRPEMRVRSDQPEFLFIVTPDLDVVELDPGSLRAVSSGADLDFTSGETACRAYALGLAGSGETDRAVDLLLRIPKMDLRRTGVHQRMAAMILLERGRTAEAESILSKIEPFTREIALRNLPAVLAEPVPGKNFDGYALRAFGIAENDVDALRSLMRWFDGKDYAPSAARFARRVLALRPGDLEAQAVLRRSGSATPRV